VPVGLTATSNSDSSIHLSWGAVATPANCSVTYSVYRGAKGFSPASGNLITSGLTSPSFANTGLAASTAYSYAVKAVDTHGSSAASAQATATTQALPVGMACHVTYSVVGDWGTGFEVLVTVANTGSTNWSNWTLGWTFPNSQTVNNLWNGVATESGEKVAVASEPYNGSVAAGSSLQGVGFVGNYSGTNGAPTAFTVNGVTCK
jgi:hypothetical protein